MNHLTTIAARAPAASLPGLNPTSAEAIELLTCYAKANGHGYLSLESLEEIRDRSQEWSWHSMGAEIGVSGMALNAAFRRFMADGRALFGIAA